MTVLRRLLYHVIVALRLACVPAPAVAEPHIEVGFGEEAASGAALVQARAQFPAASTAVRHVFDAISEYPSLHDWIEAARLVDSDGHHQEYLVEFRFPWPVGRQWSRVRVHREGGSESIHWQQIEGSLKANRGEIAFSVRDGRAHIDYRAVIDVGLPEVLTRPYKKRFVAEFLAAANARASAPHLQLAASAAR